jgi:hypothetical protein
MQDMKLSHQARLQCVTELIKLFNLSTKRGSKRARWPWRIMVYTTGELIEPRGRFELHVGYSQASGLVVKPVDLGCVDYRTLCTS